MKQVSVIGYPRVGPDRELKKWTESYFRGELPMDTLLKNAAELRKQQWLKQRESGVNYIPSNDFSFYDTFLDMAYLLNVIPTRYRALNLNSLDTYFAMAKGYQGNHGDVKALPMKKWFNTNYHYIVPEFEKDVDFKLIGTKPFDEFGEALNVGIKTKPVIIGPFTFLKLSENRSGKTLFELSEALIPIYREILRRFSNLSAELIQLDEPSLVTDLSQEDLRLFDKIYRNLLLEEPRPKILLQTYFGDVRDSYEQLITYNFDAIGLDFIEGKENLRLVEQYGFPHEKMLFAGVVNGKNIWVNRYAETLDLIHNLESMSKSSDIVISTSCSLLHIPYTVKNEKQLPKKYLIHLAFAEEKLTELAEISQLSDSSDYRNASAYLANQAIISQKSDSEFKYTDIRKKVSDLKESDFTRIPLFAERRKLQKQVLNLPPLPTTTIGSFPQTNDVKKLRSQYKSGEIGVSDYLNAIKMKITDVIKLQENIGLDVLVHGEYERNDMVEFFGEKLSGFIFTTKGWVQSYGTRCVKPPIIFGDVKRLEPMTVDMIKYAQSLTDKPVKGMLTGPVTILNWSFPREDLPRKEIAYQIALAIKAEVEDLEAAGIKIIQIDEAALREKLPLRKCDWHSKYLDWAIRSFRLTHSGVKAETQIHTHMCYSEFADIIREIDDMDADVITFEATRSDLSIIDSLNANHFRTEVGPGVYDIHSPRVPDVDELEAVIQKLMQKLDIGKLWINPDCGLKTRGEKETIASLKNMVEAVRRIRAKIKR